jgi:hypothetical protein
MQLASQNIQLMSKHRVLSFKPQLRLEWRGQDGQNEIEQPNHSASLGDSITSSTRMKFSVHTRAVCLLLQLARCYELRDARRLAKHRGTLVHHLCPGRLRVLGVIAGHGLIKETPVRAAPSPTSILTIGLLLLGTGTPLRSRKPVSVGCDWYERSGAPCHPGGFRSRRGGRTARCVARRGSDHQQVPRSAPT